MGSNAEKIKVVGNNEFYDLDKIKDSVVKIGDKWYFRHDTERIVWLNNEQGKKRAFTVNSPKLVYDASAKKYILKSLAIYTEDGVWLDKNSPDVVTIGGKYYRRGYCIIIDNVPYLRTDPNIVQCSYTKGFFLSANGVTLSQKYYNAKYLLAAPETKTLVDWEGERILAKDATQLFDGVAGVLKTYHVANKITQENCVNVLYDFQDKTNPQEDRLVFHRTPTSSFKVGKNFHPFYFFPGESEYYVHTSQLDYFNEKKEKYIVPRRLTKLDTIKQVLNRSFSDLDETENTAVVFTHVPKPFPGKHNIYTPESYGTPVLSKQFSKTGGIEFSFGVEFESSDGLVPKEIAKKYRMLMVGDRSVGAAEYVTSPLQGDVGVDLLESFCNEGLKEHTLVDDRCGLHVHVGSLYQGKDKPELYQAPKFDKHFMINSIKLGALIEQELYSVLPPSRKPTLYHCHSIKRWHDISKDNFDVYMGAYIFGQKEWWLAPTEQCPTQLFDFKKFKLNGTDRNHNASVGQWAEGRYKWLNLIHAYTQSSHRTIEFRIFPGTTTFNKTYAYLLTSLAFTYVVNNNPEIIKDGITLSQMFKTAYKGYPKLITFLEDFYEERKARFNRTQIYPKLDLPFLK